MLKTHPRYVQREVVQLNPTRRQNNPPVITRGMRVKKPVWNNKEIQNTPQKSQCRCIGCICVIPDRSSDQPDPGQIQKSLSSSGKYESTNQWTPN